MVFSSIPGLYPLDDSNSAPQNCLQTWPKVPRRQNLPQGIDKYVIDGYRFFFKKSYKRGANMGLCVELEGI